MRRIEFEEFSSLQHFNRTGELPHEENRLVTRLGDVAHLIEHIQLYCAPQSGTTTTLSEWVAWCLGRQPDCQFLYATDTARAAESFVIQVRKLMDTDEYRSLFPGIEATSPGQGSFTTPQGGHLYGVGAGAAVRGIGAGHGEARWRFSGALIVDNLVPGDMIDGEKARRRQWFEETLRLRLGHPRVPVIEIVS